MSSPNFELRLLDPHKDLELFRESYEWRRHKNHALPAQAPFSTFIADDPKQIVIGLFNGEFVAVYLLYETEPRHMDCHMTSKRGTPKELLIEGGKAVVRLCFENGAEELSGWITPRNVALRHYLEALGFQKDTENSSCENDTDFASLDASQGNCVKYALRREFP